MKRKIIEIDEEKCDGCGQCIEACYEGALALVGGKARLVAASDNARRVRTAMTLPSTSCSAPLARPAMESCVRVQSPDHRGDSPARGFLGSGNPALQPGPRESRLLTQANLIADEQHPPGEDTR